MVFSLFFGTSYIIWTCSLSLYLDAFVFRYILLIAAFRFSSNSLMSFACNVPNWCTSNFTIKIPFTFIHNLLNSSKRNNFLYSPLITCFSIIYSIALNHTQQPIFCSMSHETFPSSSLFTLSYMSKVNNVKRSFPHSYFSELLGEKQKFCLARLVQDTKPYCTFFSNYFLIYLLHNSLTFLFHYWYNLV